MHKRKVTERAGKGKACTVCSSVLEMPMILLYMIPQAVFLVCLHTSFTFYILFFRGGVLGLGLWSCRWESGGGLLKCWRWIWRVWNKNHTDWYKLQTSHLPGYCNEIYWFIQNLNKELISFYLFIDFGSTVIQIKLNHKTKSETCFFLNAARPQKAGFCVTAAIFFFFFLTGKGSLTCSPFFPTHSHITYTCEWQIKGRKTA